MAAGYSLHFGVNYVDARHHGGTFPLPWCGNDAHAMALLAAEKEFEVLGVFINQEATAARLLAFLDLVAAELKKGDLLLITFSGHGTKMKDRDGDEEDDQDEAWVLYDRVLIDDELARAWSAFKKGVRILVVADSCHSGSSVKQTGDHCFPFENEGQRQKMLSGSDSKAKTSQGNKNIAAEVLLLAACGDKQSARAGSRSGEELSLFTDELLTVYRGKKFNGTYGGLVEVINQRIPDNYFQRPEIFTINKGTLSKQYPFTINPNHH